MSTLLNGRKIYTSHFQIPKIFRTQIFYYFYRIYRICQNLLIWSTNNFKMFPKIGYFCTFSSIFVNLSEYIPPERLEIWKNVGTYSKSILISQKQNNRYMGQKSRNTLTPILSTFPWSDSLICWFLLNQLSILLIKIKWLLNP